MLMRIFRFRFVFVPLLLAGCAPMVPKAELEAYLTGYNKAQETTNSVLDLTVPFEREMMRSLAVKRPATGSAVATSLPPGVDPSLLVTPSVSAELDTEIDATLGEIGVSLGLENCPPGRGVYCYRLRDAYATIGDPPLVKSVRRLSDVLFRFNQLLAAYAAGASANLLKADFNRLQSDLGILMTVTESQAPGIGQAVTILQALTKPLVSNADYAQFGVYLKENYRDVARAFTLLAESSEALYGNVRTATLLRERAATSKPERQTVVRQREEMRVLLANWSVLIDGVREQLGQLAMAAEHPGNLETRLHNLASGSTETSVNAELLTREIFSMIGGVGGNESN